VGDTLVGADPPQLPVLDPNWKKNAAPSTAFY
jgi:hypothetical protein